jgi:hypothetical protein
MTTITFKRSGGFIGKGMRFQLTLDELPSGDANALLRLIEQAEFFHLPENLIVKFNPDEYQYTITVDAGVLCHTVRTNDTTMPRVVRTPDICRVDFYPPSGASESNSPHPKKGRHLPAPAFASEFES